MKTFKDSAGRTWTISLNTTAVKRVRASLDINLLDVASDGGTLIQRIESDICLLCDILYVLCKDEADKLGLTDEEFGKSMAGEVIDIASAAFLEELVCFFPAARGRLLAKALSKANTHRQKAEQTMLKALDDPRVDQAMDMELAKMEADFSADLDRLLTPKNSSGSAPESLA